MEKTKVFIESYNEVVRNHFDTYYNRDEKEMEKLARNENKFMEFMKKAFDTLDNSVKCWEDSPLESLDGATPKEYVAAVGGIGELMELFKEVAIHIDDEIIPVILAERFEDFGEESVQALLKVASDTALLNTEGEEISIVVNAVRLLGMLKAFPAVDGLISLMLNCKEDDELVLETVASALVEIGAASVEPLLEKVEAAAAITSREEYMLECLAKIGSESKSDRIFRCLRDSFRRMDNKVLGALCLGDYGDGRAIPTLRGYVEKNMDAIDRETFYEIAYTVELLGGDMSDIEVDFDEDDEDDENWDD